MQRSFVGEFEKQEKEAWRMDRERSYAQFRITPIIERGRKRYQLDKTVEIRPYPNPLGFGGLWGMGYADDRAEVDRRINLFLLEVEKWKARGLERIEVIEEPEMTRVEYSNKRRGEMVQEYAEKGGRYKPTPQLRLM